jgi:glycosyltransferase involved in cell wall biosynthesis
MEKVRRYKNLSKKALKKARSRSFTNFYNGKSLPVVIYKTARFTARKGPVQTLKLIKHQMLLGMSPHLSFPNGLVSGVERRRIDLWFKEHGKKVSLIIPSYNDYELLKAAVASIAKTVPAEFYDLFIVDDYCTATSRKYLKEFESANVHVIYRQQNGGFGKAVNTGFKAALKKFPSRDVVLVNSDIVAHEYWLESLEFGAYGYHKDVGIVGPKLLYPDGRIQSGGSYRNTEAPEWFDHYYRFQPSDYGPANVPQYCIGVTGACMYIKNSTVKKLGLLDEKFPFAFEDADYCLRGWQLGIRTLYYPAAELTHVESASRPKNAALKPREIASIKFFWERWGDWFDKRNVTTPDGKLKIIYVLQTTGVSGGHRIVFEHLNRLQKLGHQVELWSLDKHPTWVPLNVPSRTFKNYDRLIKALSVEDAIKVATWWETSLPVWLSSVNHGIPIYFIQEMETWFYPDDAQAQRAVISCYRKEFRNLTTSLYNLDEIRSLGLAATAVPCGFDPETFHPLPEVSRDNNSLLAIGRSFFQKNFKQTFEAWKLLGEKRPNLTLFGAEPQMVKKYKGEKLMSYVTKPSDAEVNKLYNQATAFVQTSYHEGFCLPLLEAMATGCPVVCTDAHGNRDFCKDGQNCLIVKTDNTEDLSRQLKRLLGSPKLQQQLSAAALKTVKRYQWPTVIKDIERFYLDVAAQKNAGYIQKVIADSSAQGKVK